MEKEQREQVVYWLEEGMEKEMQTLVKIIFQTIFYKNSFNLWFKLNFQGAFQQVWGRREGMVGENDVRWWWTDFVKKMLVVEGVKRIYMKNLT